VTEGRSLRCLRNFSNKDIGLSGGETAKQNSTIAEDLPGRQHGLAVE
jgi:hypothetical protein